MKYLKVIRFSQRFYGILAATIGAFVLGHFVPFIYIASTIAVWVLLALVWIDILLLFASGPQKIKGQRIVSERFSNGDQNDVDLHLQSAYPFPVKLTIIDEVPIQFQIRDFKKIVKMTSEGSFNFSYQLRPTKRGEYHFGCLNIWTQSPIGLLMRRFIGADEKLVKVYPSFKQMRQFEMMAISNRLTDVGVKKVRQLGHQMEFDQIKEYNKGDDIRSINWKATARKNQLMVNQYQEERSQQVISAIDMGRTMKMPFDGMTLLDYAINTSLVLSNMAMLKQDKAGLITFNNQIQSVVIPQRSSKQMQVIMENLYKQQSDFGEHSFASFYTHLRRKVNKRSLIVLYTNFESLNAVHRELPILQKLSRDHRLVLVLFENTELQQLTQKSVTDLEGIYIKTIAQKFVYDKRLIARELERYGIHTILTAPDKLTVNTINKYLEIKARGML